MIDPESGFIKDDEAVIIDGIWQENTCESLFKYCSSEWLLFPVQPTLFRYFQFVYFTNRTVEEFETNIAPDLVCFHGHRCSVLLSKIISIDLIDELICTSIFSLIGTDRIDSFDRLNNYFYFITKECSTLGVDMSCPNASLFYCERSKKCISIHRIVDGTFDCSESEDEYFDACQLNDSNRFPCSREMDAILSYLNRVFIFEIPMKNILSHQYVIVIGNYFVLLVSMIYSMKMIVIGGLVRIHIHDVMVSGNVSMVWMN